MKYAVQAIESLTPTALLLTVRPASDEHLLFLPGQYAGISFTRFGRKTPVRCFSMINQPADDGVIQFGIRMYGAFSHALQQLHSGDIVELSGPFGTFSYVPERDRHAVFAAGGIGITPILGIIASYAPLYADNTFTLLYSARTQQDVPFADQLIALSKHYTNVRIGFIIGAGSTERFGSNMAVNGLITADMIARASHNAYDHTSYFVCGPLEFMNTVTDILESHDVPPHAIQTESFSQSQVADTSSWARLRSRFTTIYSLSAAVLIVLFGVIAVAANNTADTSTAPVVQQQPVETETSSSQASGMAADNQSEMSEQTVITESPSTSSPSYQSPTSTVS